MERVVSYKCYYDYCSRIFNSKYNLQRHINSKHLRIKGFACNICRKQVASRQNLIEHEFTHTGEKPFICPVSNCGKRYRQSSQLCVHKKTHKRRGEESAISSPEELQERDYIKKEKISLELPIINCFRQSEQAQVCLPILHQLLDSYVKD